MLGDSSPKTIKAVTGEIKSGQIMYQNHYGWFDRIGQGLYSLTNKGKDAIIEYKEIADYFKTKYEERNINETQ
jgi:hypothetical protein